MKRPRVSGLRPHRIRRKDGCGRFAEACRRGFSLIELLVAMMLVSIGVLGTARLTTVVITGNLVSRQLSTASVLAQELMEDARRTGSTGSLETRTEEYATIDGYPEFKRVLSVDENQPALGLTTLTVTVYWDADAKSVRLQTILGRY